MRRKRGLLWLVAGIALALLAGRWLSALYGQWAFHHALASDALWRSALATQAATKLSVFAVVLAFALANFYAVRQSIVSLVLPQRVGNLEFGEAVPTRRLTGVAFIGALALALLFAALDHDWTTIALAFNGRPFAEIEPYFGRDLGFYAYWLPFERALNSLASVLVVLVAGIVVALYAGTPSVRWDERGLYVSTWVRRHLGILGGCVLGLVAWDWRLDRFALLTEGSGSVPVLGDVAPFSTFDHRVLMPYLLLLSFAAVPVAVVFAWSMWRGYLRLSLALITAIIVGGPVMRVVLPAFAKPAAEDAEALARERPYTATRALYTRRAFGVDGISRGAPALPPLTQPQMATWVSTWDPAALTRHLQLGHLGTDVEAFAWQTGSAGLHAALLRGAPADAPPGTRWLSDRVVAHAADVRGLPVAASGASSRGVAGVLVTPGAPRYALVADTTGRLAAPRFETTIERIALSWDQQNPRLMAIVPPSPRPRLMTHLDVEERIARVAPFFRAGPTITPIVRTDSLYWVVELFSVAREYPLSERLSFAGVGAHYVHHAATAVVQAQSGHVMLLPAADVDSIAGTWMGLFPELFTPRDEAPRWLATALPPPVDWVVVQGTMLGRMGFRGDSVPMRTLARVDDADADLAPGPVTLFQGDSAGVSGWGIPVVGSQDAISGLLTTRGGLWPRTAFVPSAVTLGWTEVLEQLQSGADQAGFGRALSHSRRGRVQSIPTAQGAAFTQSFYEWPPDGPPRLAGVVVLMQGRTMVGRSLAEALGQREEAVARGMPVEVFRARVATLYDAMAAALRAGDWRAYGEAWAALGRLLGRP